jgi:hypothetical protein
VTGLGSTEPSGRTQALHGSALTTEPLPPPAVPGFSLGKRGEDAVAIVLGEGSGQLVEPVHYLKRPPTLILIHLTEPAGNHVTNDQRTTMTCSNAASWL